MWVDKVIPFPTALLSLNESLATTPFHYNLRANQTQMICDLPWGSEVIPLDAVTGIIHTTHCIWVIIIYRIHIAYNGNSLYNVMAKSGQGRFIALYCITEIYRTLKYYTEGFFLRNVGVFQRFHSTLKK